MDKNPERRKNLGRRIEVCWDDGSYYRGTITGYSKSKGYTIFYDDGDFENVDLRAVQFRLLVNSAPILPAPPIPSKGASDAEVAAYEAEVVGLVDQEVRSAWRW